MRHVRHRWRVVLLGIVLIVLGTSVALAGHGGYHLDWWTVDAGGGTGSGDSYTLHGTIGQPDAGTLSGDDYTLAGGFWESASTADGGDAPPSIDVYVPLVLK